MADPVAASPTVGDPPSWQESLGDYGARLGIELDGQWYYAAYETPRLLACIEQVCVEYYRDKTARTIEGIPDHNTPGTQGFDLAREEMQNHVANLRGNAYRPATSPGKPGGKLFQEWAQSDEGGIGMMLACFRVHHPEMTIADMQDLIARHSDRMSVFMAELGKRMAARTKAIASKKTASRSRPHRRPS